jgi:hypothetical protein
MVPEAIALNVSLQLLDTPRRRSSAQLALTVLSLLRDVIRRLGPSFPLAGYHPSVASKRRRRHAKLASALAARPDRWHETRKFHFAFEVEACTTDFVAAYRIWLMLRREQLPPKLKRFSIFVT